MSMQRVLELLKHALILNADICICSMSTALDFQHYSSFDSDRKKGIWQYFWHNIQKKEKSNI